MTPAPRPETKAATLLASDEPPAFERFHAAGRAPLLLVCDHASRRVPRALGGLGLPAAELERHIAWDIGAVEVAKRLAARLDAPLLFANYSRLVVDCNRHPDHPTAIPEDSDGTEIPGNLALTAAARTLRFEGIFRPYHAAIDSALAALQAKGRVPALISVHSFTPTMQGFARPWQVGVLWDRDGRIAKPLMAALGAEPGINVGDNLPYSGREPAGYTIVTHAEAKGWPHVAIELRQDLVADPPGAEAWCGRLAAALGPILADEALYRAV